MENNQPNQIVVVQSKKSMGVALILTFLFGPLGMLYSTVVGGLIMMVLTPVVTIMTLGIGALIMWPIQLIWAGIAVSSSNKKIDESMQQSRTGSSTPQPQPTAEAEKPKGVERGNLQYYNDANSFSDQKIEELLKQQTELSADFVETLKFVHQERIMASEQAKSQKESYAKAMEVDEVERKSRIASPALYSALSITALKYIQRCAECDIKPTEDGFLATFESGYVAPETPAEQDKREQEERAQAQRAKVQQEKREKAAAEEEERAEKQRKVAITMLAIVAVVVAVMWVYTGVVAPNSLYKKQITMVDTRFVNFDSNAPLEAQKKELVALIGLYKNINIPAVKKEERTKYISDQTSLIAAKIPPIDAELKRIAEEKKRLAEEAAKKAAEEARKKAEAEIRAVVAAAAKLPVKVFGVSSYAQAGKPRNLNIPYSYTAIGKKAFGNTYSNGLRSVTLPNSITSIGEEAFNDCYDLASVNIPNSVTSIGKSAFEDCFRALTSIKIPASVKWIGERAFAGCHKLSSINIPSSVTSIGKEAFRATTIKTINIPNSVKSIGPGAFKYCKELTSVTLSNSQTVISVDCFRECYKLTSITIPNSVKAIHGAAFMNCRKLESITIPNSVTHIYNLAFSGCSSLKSITIPDSVTYINDHAFFDCTSLKSITIPNSVTFIGKEVFKDSAYNSRGKFTIHISESSPVYKKLKSEYQYDNNVSIVTIK